MAVVFHVAVGPPQGGRPRSRWGCSAPWRRGPRAEAVWSARPRRTALPDAVRCPLGPSAAKSWSWSVPQGCMTTRPRTPWKRSPSWGTSKLPSRRVTAPFTVPSLPPASTWSFTSESMRPSSSEKIPCTTGMAASARKPWASIDRSTGRARSSRGVSAAPQVTAPLALVSEVAVGLIEPRQRGQRAVLDREADLARGEGGAVERQGVEVEIRVHGGGLVQAREGDLPAHLARDGALQEGATASSGKRVRATAPEASQATRGAGEDLCRAHPHVRVGAGDRVAVARAGEVDGGLRPIVGDRGLDLDGAHAGLGAPRQQVARLRGQREPGGARRARDVGGQLDVARHRRLAQRRRQRVEGAAWDARPWPGSVCRPPVLGAAPGAGPGARRSRRGAGSRRRRARRAVRARRGPRR